MSLRHSRIMLLTLNIVFVMTLSSMIFISNPINICYGASVDWPKSTYLKQVKKVIRVGLSKAEEKVNLDVGNRLHVYTIDKLGRETLWFKVSKVKKLTLEPSSIHLQIGNKLKTRKQAAIELYKIARKVPDAFVGYDDGWKLYVGSYSNLLEAGSALSDFKSRLKLNNITIDAATTNVVDLKDTYGMIFSYNTKNSNVVFRSGENKSIGYYSSGITRYRGSIGVEYISSAGLFAINYVNIEDYLKSVVTKEMSSSWPLEALKAQAVAARTYAISNFGKHGSKGYDVCDTQDCQVYGGASAECKPYKYGNRPNLAVSDTEGVVAAYDGKLITTYYHSNSGGRTENSEYVWYSPVPYLQGKADPYSLESGTGYSNWNTRFSFADVQSKLLQSGYNIGSLRNISVTERSPNGRVVEILFSGSYGDASIRKENIRSLLGYSSIRSSLFNCFIDTSSSGQSYNMNSKDMGYLNSIVFAGSGSGHGIGMSQWGAWAMAKNHYFKFDKILKFYYTNISLNRVKYQ